MKTGSKALSAVCDTEVMVIKGADVVLSCGGAPMVAERGENGSVEPGRDAGTQLGKRYVHEPSGLQVLCIKPGAGALSVGDELLEGLSAKKLPSSD